jgi:hypothetical protein
MRERGYVEIAGVNHDCYCSAYERYDVLPVVIRPLTVLLICTYLVAVSYFRRQLRTHLIPRVVHTTRGFIFPDV